MPTIGRVLWNNIWRKATGIVYSGANVPGYEYINAIDWLDWSLFATQLSATTTLTAYFPFNTSFDSWGFYNVPFNTTELPDEAVIGLSLIGAGIIGQPSGTCQVLLQKETGVGTGVYSTIDSTIVQSTQAIFYREFTPLVLNGERLRMTFINAGGSQLYIRDFAVGSALRFPLGQHADIAPPSLGSGFVITNTQSVNGSILGRQTRRSEKTATIMLEPVSDAWVRASWEPFTRHAAREAFYWSWDYELHPQDVAFCAATDIVAPENTSPVPYMKVTLPMKVLT